MEVLSWRHRCSRRDVLKLTAAGAVALSTSALLPTPKACASSGELNLFFWPDEVPAGLLEGFTRKTGIRVNLVGFGSNNELLARLRAANGRGYDIVSPTYSQGRYWEQLGLTQAWDPSRVPLANISDQGLRLVRDWEFDNRGPHWLPHVWGAHGIAWHTERWQPDGLLPSYGDIWDDANAGKVMGDTRGLMLGTCLWLEETGVLESGALVAAYRTEKAFRRIWDVVLDFCVRKKKNLKLLWNGADMQRQGFMQYGVALGITWDGPPTAMKNQGLPIMFRSPREGALGWVDGMSLLKKAENLDAAYAFVNYVCTAEVAGRAMNAHGYNSFVRGAVEHAGEQYRGNFADAYPGDALSRMITLPMRPAWYTELNTDYENRFKNA